VIARLDRFHPRPDIADDAGALMAEDRRKQAFRIRARPSELVGVANSGRHDLDQHLAFARPLELNGGDLERLTGLECDGGFHVHMCFPSL